ncbi:MAG: sulfurtransferase [Pirellulaceae bacterium]|nr:sulfurtransferase [Pirellulaceae bacterium]
MASMATTYTSLISATDLAGLMGAGNPTAGEAGVRKLAVGELVVFDVRFSLADPAYGRRAFEASHLPGAYYLHLDEDLSSPILPGTGRHPLPDLEQFTEVMRRHGVSGTTQVVAYDDAGGMFAARLWWLLKWLGHEAVAVLDGGLPAWQRQPALASAGLVSTARALPMRGSFTATPDPNMLQTADEVQAGLSMGTIVLCDARAPERYRGDVEPIDKVAGHVPGAMNVPFSQNLDSQGCFKSAEQLRTIHGSHKQTVVHMCGSGVTACHNLVACAAAGLPIPKLYAGSWSEWITDPKRPVVKDV